MWESCSREIVSVFGKRLHRDEVWERYGGFSGRQRDLTLWNRRKLKNVEGSISLTQCRMDITLLKFLLSVGNDVLLMLEFKLIAGGNS